MDGIVRLLEGLGLDSWGTACKMDGKVGLM